MKDEVDINQLLRLADAPPASDARDRELIPGYRSQHGHFFDAPFGRLGRVDEQATGEVRLAAIYPYWTERHDQLVAKLLQERDAILSIRDRNVMQVHEVGLGLMTKWPTLIIDDLPGALLSLDVQESRRRMSVPRALGICIQVLEGLHAIHNVGLVHGNIRPSSIFLCAGREPRAVKLLGPGLSWTWPVLADWDGDLMKCPEWLRWAAPEAIADPAKLTPASDIYSVGLLFYWLVSGNLPWGAKATNNQLTMAQLNRKLPKFAKNDSLAWVDHVIRRFTMKDPERRGGLPAASEARTMRGILCRIYPQVRVLPAPERAFPAMTRSPRVATTAPARLPAPPEIERPRDWRRITAPAVGSPAREASAAQEAVADWRRTTLPGKPRAPEEIANSVLHGIYVEAARASHARRGTPMPLYPFWLPTIDELREAFVELVVDELEHQRDRLEKKHAREVRWVFLLCVGALMLVAFCLALVLLLTLRPR